LIRAAAIVAECGGLDIAFAPRSSTRWLLLGTDASSRIFESGVEDAAFQIGGPLRLGEKKSGRRNGRPLAFTT
jgi:hypothetical protein